MNKIEETSFYDQIKIIKGMNKTQLLVTLIKLAHSLKEDSVDNCKLLEHAVEIGLTYK